MLQHFFATKVGPNPTAGLFEGLKVSGHPEIMDHQGRYPVIFITLKAVRGRDFDECLATFKGVIAHLFDSHRYLLTKGKLEEDKQARYQRFLQEEASTKDYKESLLFLSELLYAHHGEQVVILMDEYAQQEVASNNCIASL